MVTLVTMVTWCSCCASPSLCQYPTIIINLPEKCFKYYRIRWNADTVHIVLSDKYTIQKEGYNLHQTQCTNVRLQSAISRIFKALFRKIYYYCGVLAEWWTRTTGTSSYHSNHSAQQEHQVTIVTRVRWVRNRTIDLLPHFSAFNQICALVTAVKIVQW